MFVSLCFGACVVSLCRVAIDLSCCLCRFVVRFCVCFALLLCVCDCCNVARLASLRCGALGSRCCFSLLRCCVTSFCCGAFLRCVCVAFVVFFLW